MRLLTVLLYGVLCNAAVFIPVEHTGLMQTPGAGFQTFHRFLSDDPSIANAGLVSGSAYFRWIWTDIEPADSQYNWKLIDDCLASARADNQTLEFRVMLMSPGFGAPEMCIPQWLVDKGVSTRYTFCEAYYYSPDLEDTVLQRYHNRLIRAIGKRYDGHPDLGSVDIGSVGMWGEWHEYCHPENIPSLATRKAIIDLYYDAFPTTPLVMLVGDEECLLYAASKGRTAWRGDCWGDYGTEAWHHHQQVYSPRAILLGDAWKRGLVALEACGVMSGWDPAELTAVVDDAIGWHVSLANNKSSEVPVSFRPEAQRLAAKLGYRLVLRSLSCPDTLRPGSPAAFAMQWRNLGIAPPYRDYRIALRLRDRGGVVRDTRVTDASVRGFLPGDTAAITFWTPPSGLPAGSYDLETGLVLAAAVDRIAPVAIEGKTADNWYRLGAIAVSQAPSVENNAFRRSLDLITVLSQENGALFILAADPAEYQEIIVYSIKGERVARLPVSGPKISWTGCRSGVYLCRLRGKAEGVSRKFVVIR